MKIDADTWLAGIFERPVYRVSMGQDEAADAAECRRRVAESVGGKPAFLYAKIPTLNTAQVSALTHAGFEVVDVSVTFDRSPTPRLQAASSATIVRDVQPADFDATLDVAERCFVYSRFHLDRQVPKPIANRIKREWIDSYCHGRRGERLLVSETDGQISGFLAVIGSRAGEKRASVIDLVGVSGRFQRRGIGERLVAAFIERGSGADVLRVGTQAANIPSMRLYEKCGFSVTESAFVLHAHIGS